MMPSREFYLQDGGLRARTTAKDEFSKQSLKLQLMQELDALQQRLEDEKGASDTSLQQSYKAMIQARQAVLKGLP